MVRVALVVALSLTLWHVGASFLWIAPVSTLRQLVPGDLLTQYMIPWYGQSWSVFAPEPINGDYHFVVRAVVIDDTGAEQVTDWISATTVEQTLSQHNLFPPRAAGLGVHQASTLMRTYDNLSKEQQALAALDYYTGDVWLGTLKEAMDKDSDNAGAVVNYIVQERYADAYATQIARAVFGDKVVRVQYEASRQNIVGFNDRNDPNAALPAPQLAPTGWRGTIELPGQSEGDFAATFLPAYKNLTKQ